MQLPIPFTISIWTQSDFAGLLGPAVDGWRIGLHPLDGLPQLSFLFWSWFRTALVYSLYGAVAAAIFPIITALGVFVVQGWTGDMAVGAEWSGPTRDHDGVAAVGGHHHGDPVWRRSRSAS